MPGRTVTRNTFQPFLKVDAVIKFNDLFLHCVSRIQYIEVTIHTPLGGEFIVSHIYRRDKLISGMSEYVPSLRG